MKAKRALSLALAVTLCAGLLTVPVSAAGVTVTEVVPCKYDYAAHFSAGLAAVLLDGKWGYIDQTGREVVPCKYDEVKYCTEGLAAVKSGGKWGFVATSGREVVPCRYDKVEDFFEGMAAVCTGKEDGLWGFVDSTGSEVIPCEYVHANSFSAGLAAVQRASGEKIIFIDKTGKEIMSCNYDTVNCFVEGLAEVELNDKWGFIDKTGREVVPCKYDDAEAFAQGMAAVKLGDKWGFVDTTGREVVACKYGKVRAFSDGLAEVSLPGEPHPEEGYTLFKWGFVNKAGKEIVPAGKYYNIESFSEGLAEVCSWDNRRGYIDTTGKEVIPCKYRSAGAFSDGVAVVADENNQWGLIDKTGREVVPFGKYISVSAASEGFVAVRISDRVEQCFKWGFLSINAAPTAQPSTQAVTVDGKKVEFAMYALNNGSVNYIRVRDLAALLNGTAAQFEVGWDGKVALTAKSPYTGSADQAPFNTEMPYTVYTEPTVVNGSPVALDAIQIEYNGGGYTYYKLRDLAQALGFNVGWSAEKGVYVETDKPYDVNN